MLVVHKHKKNINLSRDMNYRSLLFLVLLLWAWQIKKWPKPQIKGLVWKKILILYCLHKLGNLLYEKHGQKANSKFFECPRVLGSYHPWMTIFQVVIFFFHEYTPKAIGDRRKKKNPSRDKNFWLNSILPFFCLFWAKNGSKKGRNLTFWHGGTLH